MKILVTGASGFIGQAVSTELACNSRYSVLGAVRNDNVGAHHATSGVKFFSVGSIDADTDWHTALKDVDVVIHLAARAHILNESREKSLADFDRINVQGALNLARQALEAGAQRFIFISSIGVNGAFTIDHPFNELSLPAPHADYALSKLKAEQGLAEVIKTGNMELVVIRPPLVYAGHAPGNFGRLLRMVASGVPLPFGLLRNQRSLIALENLVDFIKLCIEHRAAANGLFLISNGKFDKVDCSTRK